MKKTTVGLLVGVFSLAGWLLGQETAKTSPTLLHVFAYTPVATATPDDFDNFKRETGDLVGKIPGLRRVWVGKLKMPLDAQEGPRVYGVGMEFDDTKALEVYGEHPAHEAWERVYRRVRIPGTTTIDILGE